MLGEETKPGGRLLFGGHARVNRRIARVENAIHWLGCDVSSAVRRVEDTVPACVLIVAGPIRRTVRSCLEG
jgi:hypothetical protein